MSTLQSQRPVVHTHVNGMLNPVRKRNRSAGACAYDIYDTVLSPVVGWSRRRKCLLCSIDGRRPVTFGQRHAYAHVRSCHKDSLPTDWDFLVPYPPDGDGDGGSIEDVPSDTGGPAGDAYDSASVDDCDEDEELLASDEIPGQMDEDEPGIHGFTCYPCVTITLP